MADSLDKLKEMLTSEDEETRRSAVIGLAGIPLPETRESLFAALGDSSWRVRKEAVDALIGSSIGEETMEELVSLLASHDNAGLRNSTVELLERLGSRALPVLSRHAGVADHDVRKFVLDIMGSIGDPQALPVLVKALDDPEPNVSAAAAENLGKIGAPDGVPHLVAALKKGDVWLRFTILEALGRIGRPVPIDVVAPMAGENLLKKGVFDCLGAIGGNEALPLLMEGIRERVRNAREAAATALMKVRRRLPVSVAFDLDKRLRELRGAPFVDGLLASLDTGDRNLQESLIGLLGLIGDERAIGAILSAARDERLRDCALAAFRTMGEATAGPLVGFFQEADEEERCFIAHICGELRIAGAKPLLLEGMRNGGPMLRRVAAMAAGKSGFHGMTGEVALLLDDPEREVRDGAIEALSRLAKIDGEEVQCIAARLALSAAAEKRREAALLFASLGDGERLSLLIKDEDAMVRRTAVNALASLNLESSVGHLLMALVDEDADVRIAAIGALGGGKGDEVLAPLLLMLKDEDPWVRCAALKSLGRLGHTGAQRPVAELLDSSDGLVTITALETLAEIGGEGVEGMVKKGLENNDEEVVKAAINILSGMGSAWLEEYRDRLLAHPHWDVRSSFIRAMAAGQGEGALPHLQAALEVETDGLVREQILDIMDRYR